MNDEFSWRRGKTILGSRNGIEIIGEILTKRENNEGGGSRFISSLIRLVSEWKCSRDFSSPVGKIKKIRNKLHVDKFEVSFKTIVKFS